MGKGEQLKEVEREESEQDGMGQKEKVKLQRRQKRKVWKKRQSQRFEEKGSLTGQRKKMWRTIVGQREDYKLKDKKRE